MIPLHTCLGICSLSAPFIETKDNKQGKQNYSIRGILKTGVFHKFVYEVYLKLNNCSDKGKNKIMLHNEAFLRTCACIGVYCTHTVIYQLKMAGNIPGPNFIELLSTKVCLAWNFFLCKNRITNRTFILLHCLVTGIQMYAYLENHVEIWLEILFLTRQTFHAKQFFVLSSSMKLDPGQAVSEFVTTTI